MRITLLSLALLSCLYLSAQSDEQAKVYQVVQDVFVAMKTNDSTLAASAFTDDAMLHTVFENDQGQFEKRSHPAGRLVSAFGKPKEQVWSEPIWNEKIEIDGGLAQVWVDYAFYVDKDFSHCGVDAFHLINTEAGWKIFHLVDTRRKEDCKVPKKVEALYK